MFKLLKIIISLALLLVIGLGTLLFTEFGTNLIKPHLSEFLSSQSNKKIEIKDMVISYDKLDFLIFVNSQNILKLNGNLDIMSLKLDLNYEIKSNDLSSLNENLQGEFLTNGKINGTYDNIMVKGSSNIAESETTYSLPIQNLELGTLKANIKDAKINKLLEIVKQPNYLNGNLNVDITMKDLIALNGNINTKIEDGKIDFNLLNEKFNTKLNGNNDLKINIDTILNNSIAMNTGTIESNLVNLTLDNVEYNIKTGSLNAENSIVIDDLGKLENLLNKKLIGKLEAKLKVSKDSSLSTNLNSQIIGGNLNIDTIDNDLKINLENVEIIDALKLLNYPGIYAGKGNGIINFNTLDQKGNFDLDLKNGHLTENKITTLVKQFLRIDLTKENFNIAKVNGVIENNTINSEIILDSKNIILKSKKSIIDLNTNQLDMILNLKYLSYDIDIIINGDLNNPSISSDSFKNVISSSIQEKLSEKLTEKFGDKVGDQTGEDLNEKAKSLLKNLLKF